VTTVVLVVVLAGYVVIATMTWRRAAWVFADKARFESQETFTNFEIVWGLFAGAVVASVWPVTLAIYATRTRGLPFVGRRFLLPPVYIRLEQKAQQVEEQQRRIAELERQAAD
jgi:hypothetical protein